MSEIRALKNKEQKPLEWSEEDEKQIRQIERIVKNAGCTSKLQEKIHNWLKSLRPSWKPSEEQMRALNYFIKLWGNSDDQLEYTKIFNTVKSLRDELEKLM